MAFATVAVTAIFLCFSVVIQRRFLALTKEVQRDALEGIEGCD